MPTPCPAPPPAAEAASTASTASTSPEPAAPHPSKSTPAPPAARTLCSKPASSAAPTTSILKFAASVSSTAAATLGKIIVVGPGPDSDSPSPSSRMKKVLDELNALAKREGKGRRKGKVVALVKLNLKAIRASAALTERDFLESVPSIRVVPPVSPVVDDEEEEEEVKGRRQSIAQRVLVKGHALLHKRDENGRCYHHGMACSAAGSAGASRRKSVVDAVLKRFSISS